MWAGKGGCACRHAGKIEVNEQASNRRLCHPFAPQGYAYKAFVARLHEAVSHITELHLPGCPYAVKCSHSSFPPRNSSRKERKHTLYPGLLLQPGHHDYSCCSLFPHHPPEVAEGFWQRSLRGNVGVLLPIPINVIGIDVITAWHS